MSNPLHAKYYADRATQHTVEVVENACIARDTWRVRFRCPELAAKITPGQFLMLRLSDFTDPLIGRPLALFDLTRDEQGVPDCVDVVYLVKGKLTTRLARFERGQKLEVWGPLGNGFAPIATDHLIMVAGGIGQTPFVALAKESLGLETYGDPPRRPLLCSNVTLCYGARAADLLAAVEHFERIGVDVRIATDDGSRGHHGLVTELVAELLAELNGNCRVVCCGPEAMMAAVARVAAESSVPCRVSLETPMACGIGICFTCVAKVRDETGECDFKRTCVEGPVFDAELIEW